MGSGTTNSAAFDSTPSTLPRISVVTRATASASAFLEMSLRRGDGVMVGSSPNDDKGRRKTHCSSRWNRGVFACDALT